MVFLECQRIQAMHFHHQMGLFVLLEAMCRRKWQENMIVIAERNLRSIDPTYSLFSTHGSGMPPCLPGNWVVRAAPRRPGSCWIAADREIPALDLSKGNAPLHNIQSDRLLIQIE
jgi:hypothetical protein